MRLNLFIVSLLVATMPVCAQAQAPQPIQSPQAPKATQAPKAPKAAKGSKEETTKVAAAQKVVKTISADKAKRRPTAISASWVTKSKRPIRKTI
jgi:hypothetical protein